MPATIIQANPTPFNAVPVDPVTLVKAAEDSITLDDDEITDAVNAAE